MPTVVPVFLVTLNFSRLARFDLCHRTGPEKPSSLTAIQEIELWASTTVLVGILRLSVSTYLVIDLLDNAVAQRTSALYISRNYEDHLIL